MDERLIVIAEEMESLITPGDPEIAHGRADELLRDTIDKLMTKENAATLIRILDAYVKIDKWYA